MQQQSVLKHATLVSVCLYPVHLIYRWCFPRRFGRSFILVIDLFFTLGAAVAETVLWHENAFYAYSGLNPQQMIFLLVFAG